MGNYEYLKRFLSRRDLKMLREGNNRLGITLTQRQVHNIMTGKSKNYPFLDILMERAKHNESTCKTSL